MGLDRIDQRGPTSTAPAPITARCRVPVYVLQGVRATHVELVGRVRAGFSAINDGDGPMTAGPRRSRRWHDYWGDLPVAKA